MKIYAVGRVYKITNSIDDLVYIGATGDTLSRRMTGHRVDCKRGKTTALHSHMRLIGVDKFSIILIEQLINCTKEQLRAKEDYFIKEFNSVNVGLNGKYEDFGICLHNIDRRYCILCKGSQTCSHNREKRKCKICNADKCKCDVCSKSYCSADNLRRHKLMCHPIVVTPEPN